MNKLKVIIGRKKNTSPNTEFEIQEYINKDDGGINYIPFGDSYRGVFENDIIDDIEINENNIYRTIYNKKLTKVIVKKSSTKYLSSINNDTKIDNITKLKEYL